ncbi:MAG: hypothetical protein EA341_07255 [Mongoliibacter sp.]|uniref:hypothetical protein n=1 Tax=Mongoliibacter sp. TaxID=2022438 RepID=UPI0012F36F86|nr:hypothetical protein [Mongoliibacter sp.]TVP50553.1 MAG: hypothetical protein EA341_07255 [Mongoliibacter sp.]
MKNSVKNLLRAGVFALAAVFAFAFTQPVDLFQPKFGMDVNGNIYDVTGITPGPGANQYNCDLPATTCTWADEDLSVPLETNGRFVPGSGLQPIGE